MRLEFKVLGFQIRSLGFDLIIRVLIYYFRVLIISFNDYLNLKSGWMDHQIEKSHELGRSDRVANKLLSGRERGSVSSVANGLVAEIVASWNWSGRELDLIGIRVSRSGLLFAEGWGFWVWLFSLGFRDSCW